MGLRLTSQKATPHRAGLSRLCWCRGHAREASGWAVWARDRGGVGLIHPAWAEDLGRWADFDGDGVQGGVATGGVEDFVVGEDVAGDTGVGFGDGHLDSVDVVAPTVGE